MKASQLAAFALAAALFPALASAQQDSTAAKSAQQQPMSVEQFDQEMAKAQENLKKMQEQMSQIQKSTDPAQRQKLMQEHQAMMQQGMHMMNGMWDGGMMGCCAGGMMGGHMMGNGQIMVSERALHLADGYPVVRQQLGQSAGLLSRQSR